jgi:LysM repeat protein
MKNGRINLFIYGVGAVVLAATQGCITTESFGSGRGAAAKHKGVWKHEHKSLNDSSSSIRYEEPIYSDEIYEPIIPPAAIVPTAAIASQTYVVKEGDILSQIALDVNSTTAELVALNGLENPDVLYIGQKLKVPGGSVSVNSASAQTTTPIERGGVYVIQSGDTISEIAQRAGVTTEELRALNQIEGSKIYAGKEIYIPSYGQVPAVEVESSASELSFEPTALIEPQSSSVGAAGEDVVALDIPAGTLEMVKEYVVYPGDTLEDVARQHSVSVDDILQANPSLSLESPLQDGFTIRIPIAE